MTAPPADAAARRAAPVVLTYAPETLPQVPPAVTAAAAGFRVLRDRFVVQPREALCFQARAGQLIRILSTLGPQVGDLNLWAADDLAERFFSGKTRALHGTHVSVGDRLWSAFPYLRPMATITADTLGWYGIDADGCRVHDVIGTRCDPYTHWVLTGQDYHHCCHSNLVRALADHLGCPLEAAEPHIHDVLNVFMCTGFDRASGRYIMKASPVRPGDHLDLFAEIDLLGALSACPGGDCSACHSSDAAQCHPLVVEVYDLPDLDRTAWQPSPPNGYSGRHGRPAP